MPEPRPFAAPGTPSRWVRPRPFGVEHVDLAISIDLDAATVEGEVEHRVRLSSGPRPAALAFDQQDLEISGAWIDGAPATWNLSAGAVSVDLPAAAGDCCRVRLRFVARRPVKGLAFVSPPGPQEVPMAWTQGAMEDHRYWFPCWDDPNNLSTIQLAVRHRAVLQAVSNGACLERREHGDGWATTTWRHDRPHVLYLLNLVVGDLVAVRDDAASVPLTHWLPRGHEGKAASMFRASAFAIDWLARFVGVPFPWASYGHVVVHRFPWGGMENATLTTITDRVLMDAADQERDDVDCDALVIHELVHQWYGDLLTMKGWSDIWLNESFATWLEARCMAAWRAAREGLVEADELARLRWADWEAYREEDASRYRRALVTNRWGDPYELFDRVAYEKGGLILEQLCRQLGEERLRAALALYTARHARGLVETADWRQAIEDATGEPLDWWFAQWIERPGHPVLTVSWRYDAGRCRLVVEIDQKGDGEPWRLPVAIAWAGGGARAELVRTRETLVFPCATAPGWLALDPAGDLPAELTEEDGAAAFAARLADPACPAHGRARAAAGLVRHPGALAHAALARAVEDAGAPELVRQEALRALGARRDDDALAALLAATVLPLRPRLRRVLAEALTGFRRVGDGAVLAARLLALGDGESSPVTAGAWFAARGAIEHPGAVPELRRRLERPSWNEHLRCGCVRGLGASGEAAAADELLPLLRDRHGPEPVRVEACAAAAALARRQPWARPRLRAALEDLLDHPLMHTRAAAARALGRLGEAGSAVVLAGRLEREPFGNLRRTMREALEAVRRSGDQLAKQEDLERRCAELEKARKDLEARLAAVEKHLAGS